MAGELEKLLKLVHTTGGSDLHLMAGLPPKIRVHGHLEMVKNHPVMTQSAMEDYLSGLCTAGLWNRFMERRDLDFAHTVEGVARFRCNYLNQQNGYGAVFRIIPTEIKTIEQLKLKPVLLEFSKLNAGLVLVTGPTGSGKSTTLAALIDHINTNQRKHIITIEDPVEFLHRNKKSIIVHREVGADATDFASALKASMRQDPDVVLIGEMRDPETIGMAISAAEMGVLVFGTLHTNSAAKTIDRIIEVFPADQQQQVRTQLAQSLKGVVSQILCRTTDGKGRVACNEILIANSALGNIIREGTVSKIVSVIEGGRGQGMQLMDDALMENLKAGRISGDEAYMKAQDKKTFEAFVNRETLGAH